MISAVQTTKRNKLKGGTFNNEETAPNATETMTNGTKILTISNAAIMKGEKTVMKR